MIKDQDMAAFKKVARTHARERLFLHAPPPEDTTPPSLALEAYAGLHTQREALPLRSMRVPPRILSFEAVHDGDVVRSAVVVLTWSTSKSSFFLAAWTSVFEGNFHGGGDELPWRTLCWGVYGRVRKRGVKIKLALDDHMCFENVAWRMG